MKLKKWIRMVKVSCRVSSLKSWWLLILRPSQPHREVLPLPPNPRYCTTITRRALRWEATQPTSISGLWWRKACIWITTCLKTRPLHRPRCGKNRMSSSKTKSFGWLLRTFQFPQCNTTTSSSRNMSLSCKTGCSTHRPLRAWLTWWWCRTASTLRGARCSHRLWAVTWDSSRPTSTYWMISSIRSLRLLNIRVWLDLSSCSSHPLSSHSQQGSVLWRPIKGWTVAAMPTTMPVEAPWCLTSHNSRWLCLLRISSSTCH